LTGATSSWCLGIAAKVRPCVVLSIDRADSQRNMSIIVPLTTEIRGGECEVSFDKPVWLRSPSVVNVLGIAGVDNAKIIRKLAKFPERNFEDIFRALFRALGITRGVV
jgi:mRNA interferase MazF